MNEKLAAELEAHREQRIRVANLEDKKIAMRVEARELNHLATIAQDMYDKAKPKREDIVLPRALINAARRMQNVAIVRWTFTGVTNTDISEAFGLTTQRITQIKKEIMDLEKSFEKLKGI